jgi:hypothetical protein
MVVLIDEDVGWLDIPMQNLSPLAPLVRNSVMAVLKCKQQLIADLPDDFLLDKGHGMFGFLQFCSKISPGTVLHYDVNLGIRLVHHPINITYYVRMLQFLQKVHLCH